ncbi:hypothetical protein WMF30_33810 [Sorangium sp. So ce134]
MSARVPSSWPPVHLRWWWDAGPREGPAAPRDPAALRAIVARLADGPGALAALRRLLAVEPGWHLRQIEDGQLVELIVGHVAAGRLVLEEEVRWRSFALDGEPGAEEEPVSAPVRQARPEPEPEPAAAEPGTFPPDVDALALALARQEAARTGVPFCEECVKRRRDTAGAAAQ